MKKRTRSKGFKLRKIVALMGLALGFAGVFVAHVWKQNTYIGLSLDAAKFEMQKAKLLGDVALLELEVGDLRKPERIERLAKEKFGLEYGVKPILVYPDGESAGAKSEVENRAFGGTGGAAEKPSGDRKLETAGAEWPTNGL